MPKFSTKLFLLGMMLVCFGSPVSAEDEWVVTQEENTFYVSKNAVRAVNHEGGYEMVAKAPDWTCYAYRPDKKIIWQTPMSRFNSLVFIRPFMDRASLRSPPRRLGKATISGFKCTEYRTSKGLLYGSEQVKAAPKAIEFVNRFLFTSTIPEIPLFDKQERDTAKYVEKPWFDKARYNFNVGRTSIVTLSVKKKNYLPKDFALPLGYKKTANVKDIAYSEAKKHQFEDVIEGVGFMSSDKEQKRH